MELHVLGRPCLTDGGKEIALQPQSLALLTYLAVGGPRHRIHLAELFWSSSATPLNTLSSALNRIRAKAPDAIWTRGQDEVGCDLRTELDELRTAADGGDVSRVNELYQAPFLSGLKVRRMRVEFEDWMLDQRSSLAQTVEMSLLRESHRLHSQGDHSGAGAVAEDAWMIATRDGFPSPDHLQAYHRILAESGRASARAVRSMADEFGIELEPVLAADLVKPAPRPAPLSPTGQQASASQLPIFGFDHEKRLLSASVESNRITTLVGLGGSGKTRLAENYFHSADVDVRYDQRYWVSLREVDEPHLVGPAIAATVDVSFAEGPALTEQLPPHQSTLVVLDNFEHVVDVAHVATDLVAGHAGVTVLVTSREPLGIGGEALVRLGGLALNGDSQSLSPAEELFISAAQRVGTSPDRLTGSNAAAVRQVCERLGGNPLALELAGAWVALLTPAEVLDSLSDRIELLDGGGAHARSMTLVLEQSWAALGERERQTLLLLSTFPAGCPVAETAKIAELSLPSIRELVQRSMVSSQNDGRLMLHPLIADLAKQELGRSAEADSELRRVQSVWAHGFVRDAKAAITSGGASLVGMLAPELANIVEGWAWAVRTKEWALAEAAVPLLREFYAESARVLEGGSVFAHAIESVRSDDSAPAHVLPELLEASAWLKILVGRPAEASTLLDQALAASSADLGPTHAQLLRTIGVQQLQAGKTDEAASTFQEGLLVLGEQGSNLAGRLRHDLGQAYMFRGEIDRARESFRSAMDIGRMTDDPAMVVRAYLTLGNLETDHNPVRAVVLLQEGQQVATDHGLDHLGAYFPYVRGLAHLELGDFAQAETCFDEGIDAAIAVKYPAQVCANHLGRAKMHLAQHPIDAAMIEAGIEDVQTATRLAQETQTWPYMMWAAIEAARACAASGGATEQAIRLLALTMRHEATHGQTLIEAAEALEESFGHTIDDCPVEPSVDLRLDEVAERILEVVHTARNALAAARS